MHEQVEASLERFADLAEDTRDVFVGAHVTLGHERAGDGLGQLTHALLDSLALIRERELGAAVGEPLGDRPRDRAAVRNSENQTTLALIGPSHCTSHCTSIKGEDGRASDCSHGLYAAPPSRRLSFR